jgi:hypothetical protein
MPLSVMEVADKVANLRLRYQARDGRMKDVLEVRKGNLSSVAEQYFPEGIDKPMIANFVDVAARDMAEMLAPLPSFNCHPSNQASEASVKQADTRTMIANHYIQFSNLETQMYTGTDWYLTYGFLPFVVEPDLDEGMPRIRLENPMGSYPEYDRYGRVTSFTKYYTKTLGELVSEFPEYEAQLIGPQGRDFANYNSLMEFVRYEDKDQVLLYVPSRHNLVLLKADNPLGKVSVRVARKPGIDPDDPRGQFDDVIWVQLARARFAMLAMDAAEKSVQAPLAVPMDVQELAFGPDAVLRSNTPQGIRRVGLELPTAAFTEQSVLEGEMRMGSRYPEGRSGQIDASIITGQGVQALMGGFDTQIKTGQQILADVLEEVLSLCFEMDEKIFSFRKEVSGAYSGAPYKLTYNPETAIKGDYTITVRYGLMSGLDPSRALIFSLQALQAGLLSRDLVMRELPFSINVSQVQRDIEVERMRDQLSGSFASLAQAIPQMAMQGQDPSSIVAKISEVIQKRKAGKTIEDAVSAVFAVEPPPAPVQPTPEEQGMGMMTAPAVAEPPVEQPTNAPNEAPAGATPPQAPPGLAQILGSIMGGQ